MTAKTSQRPIDDLPPATRRAKPFLPNVPDFLKRNPDLVKPNPPSNEAR